MQLLGTPRAGTDDVVDLPLTVNAPSELAEQGDTHWCTRSTTVNLIRKKPSAVPTYDAMGAFGNWQTGRGAFGATGRLGSDSALYRFDIGAESREGYRHDDATRFTITPSLAWRLGANNQFNVYYTFNRDQFGGDAGLPLVDTSLGVPTEDNVPDVPRDRNYRTPQDDATSLDNNIQLAYARQFNNSLGFRDTLSYRHFNDEYFLSEEVDFIAPRDDRSLLPVLQPSPPAAHEHRRAHRAHAQG